MTTKNLTYTRPDGVKGVGYFIPFAGKYVHSVAWPDQHAERYTVDRLDRMRIQVEGMETIGQGGREYLQSELGWRFLTDEEAAEAQATVAEQLGVDPGEFFATGPELTGDELAAAEAEHEAKETATDETQQEVEGETDDEETEQASPPDVDVVSADDAVSDREAETNSVDAVTNSPAVVSDEAGTDATEVEPPIQSVEENEPAEAEATADEPVSEAQAIRDYLAENPNAANKDVVAALAERGIEISSSQVTRQRKAIGKA